MAKDPGSVEIGSITLPGIGDVSRYLISCTITESIDSPGVVCNLDLQQQQELMGGSTGGNAKIRFNSESGPARTYNLALNGFGGGSDSPNQKTKSISVELISEDMLKNQANPNYQKAHTNTKVSDMIKSTLQNGLKTKCPVNVSDTIGMRGTDNMTYCQTQRSPIEHVHRLANHNAVGSKKDDTFMAWCAIGSSGREEWNVKPLSELTKQGPTASFKNTTMTERGTTLGGGGPSQILEVMRNGAENRFSRAAGGFHQQPTKFDQHAVSGDRARNPVGDGLESKVAGNMSPNKAGTPFGASAGKASTLNIIWEDKRESGDNLGYAADTGAAREAGRNDLGQASVTVKVPGNSGISVGSVVELDLRGSNETGPAKDSHQSGKFLVTGVTHYIGPVTDNPRYVTYITGSNVTAAGKKFA